jgi:hypothetical protein
LIPTLTELHSSPLSNVDSIRKQSLFARPFAAWAAFMLASLLAVAPVLRAQTLANDETQNHPAAETPADSTAKAAAQIGTKPAATAAEDTTGWETVTYSIYEPGRGYRVGKAPDGDIWISAYALWRYINQLPAVQTSPITVGASTRLIPGTISNGTALWCTSRATPSRRNSTM